MRTLLSRVVGTAVLLVALAGCSSPQPDLTSALDETPTDSVSPILTADQAWRKCNDAIERKWTSGMNIEFSQKYSAFKVVDGEWEITFNEAPDAPEKGAPLYCATSGSSVTTYNPTEWDARN